MNLVRIKTKISETPRRSVSLVDRAKYVDLFLNAVIETVDL